ncbi:gamma-glutamyltranspeptidase [Gulbenkiania indica]|uniref:Glutathione hydrolase proenzyme n=1 Tax=Gulbenkiania indica TaxID=375574 RepID=A0A0K6GXC4_9NEIS|nr:gamma-glutamyltransferase [Gulbenkiania indica]CUA83225.1 gamma-glutamyltranspeptidase [Gulbenkiania indica]
MPTRLRLAMLAASLGLLFAAAPSTADTVPGTTAAAAIRYDYEQDIFHPVYARNGMVATEQALATQVGLDILRRGGNAVDAAVAVGFALAVVLPNAGNIGGGGFLMLHDARTGQDIALDFREMAPERAGRDMYLDAEGKVVEGRSLYTHLAVGVPGTVAGMEHALRRWGTMRLRDVIAPAIRLAEQGFTVSPTLAKVLEVEKDNLGKWPATRAIFFRGERPLKAGERLVQKDLAGSLRLIAVQGARAFYEGPIAEKIVAEMAAHGGLITAADLRGYRVAERQPVAGSYRGYRVVSMPPPSSGGTHIVQILNLLERYPLAQYGANSARSIHLMAEAMKLAYADRAEYLGDPDFVKVPVAGLTSRRYADSLAARIDPERVSPASAIKPGQPQPYESDQTTHYSIVDGKGNAVAVTYTLNLNFGSGIVARGTGILLNDQMDDFSAKPGVANAYGLIGGEANAIAPRKRPLSSMSPTLVLKEGKPWLVTGSPGGARIITTTLQTIVNAIDFGMNPAEAAATPRIHHQWLPDELRVEKGLSPDTLAILRQQGYKVSVKPTMGRTQTIQVREDGLYGYSDPRNPDGATAGF